MKCPITVLASCFYCLLKSHKINIGSGFSFFFSPLLSLSVFIKRFVLPLHKCRSVVGHLPFLCPVQSGQHGLPIIIINAHFYRQPSRGQIIFGGYWTGGTAGGRHEGTKMVHEM